MNGRHHSLVSFELQHYHNPGYYRDALCRTSHYGRGSIRPQPVTIVNKPAALIYRSPPAKEGAIRELSQPGTSKPTSEQGSCVGAQQSSAQPRVVLYTHISSHDQQTSNSFFTQSVVRQAIPRQAQANAAKVAYSSWCGSHGKRVFDIVTSVLALILLAPLLLVIALVIRLSSTGPAIFRQQRIGCHGVPFTILKFRTMHVSINGPKRSSYSDQRLTRPGRVLRRYKLDELPQLINVCRGEMSLVGPRPKLHDHNTLTFCLRPGITGAATLAFAAEEHLLRTIPQEYLEACHRELICPRKLELDLDYMANASFRSDLRLLWQTLMRAGRYTELNQLGNWRPASS